MRHKLIDHSFVDHLSILNIIILFVGWSNTHVALMQYHILIGDQNLFLHIYVLDSTFSRWWNQFDVGAVFVDDWSFFADFDETVLFLPSTNAVMITHHLILDVDYLLFTGACSSSFRWNRFVNSLRSRITQRFVVLFNLLVRKSYLSIWFWLIVHLLTSLLQIAIVVQGRFVIINPRSINIILTENMIKDIECFQILFLEIGASCINIMYFP